MSEANSITNSAIDEKIEKFKQSLSSDHVIYTMIIEHEQIFELLDKLFLINQTIQQEENYNNVINEFNILNKIIEMIIKSDLHHQREEKVLFPQLELMGIFGHPYVKKLEHENIRDYLDEILTLCRTVQEEKFSELKKRINTLVRFLIIKLKENMDDENNNIYPKAVQVITEEETWEKMKRACDRIGYFNFAGAL